MKKLISILLAVVMLCSVVPMAAYARNPYVMYGPTDSCQLTSISFTQADNPWLLWDVEFAAVNGNTVLETEKDHPGLVGSKVIPAISYVGNSITINGKAYAAGDEVTIKAENEIVIADTDNHNFAEYTVYVTEESNGLPVVLIDTDDVAIATKLNYVDTYITILGADVYGAKDLYYAPGTKAGKGGIKLRGNSTMGYAKKPYRIKFDKKQDVLGMGKAKSWVLLADYLDPSSLRNQVAFNLANRINSYTAETTGFQVFSPRMKLVEVYLNGEYKGLYEMGDHMQANELRVDISELGDEDSTAAGQDIGYFIEVEVQSRVLTEGADGYEDWSAYSWIEGVGSSSGKNQDPDKTDDVKTDALYFQFKLPEEPSDDQKAYITDLMQEVNDLILANDDAVWEIIDMDSVIDWYLVNELFKNVDSQMQSSVYFFKNGLKDTDGNLYENPNTKLYMGPVWDFDLGAGAVTYGSMDDATGWRTKNDEYCGWFREMFEMDSFKTALETRWADLHEEGILEAMYTDIAYLEQFAGKAAIANFDKWHSTYIGEIEGTWMTVPATSSDSVNWETQVDYFESYLKGRISWLDEQFGYAPKTTLGTITEEATLLENETFTAATTGKIQQDYTVGESIPLDKLAFELDITADTAWDFGFNLTVTTRSAAGSQTFTITPSAKNDWTGKGLVFEGTTGSYIAKGTYNDRVMDVTGAIRYQLWANYKSTMQSLGFNGWGEIDLDTVVKSVKLNSVYVKFENASVGKKATFTLQNVDENGNPIYVDKTIIAGKPSIMGDGKLGTVMFASTTELRPFSASVSYQWYADGVAISGATASTYKVTSNELGKTLTVKAHGIGNYAGTVTSDGVVVTKSVRTSTYKHPDFESVTSDSLTVTSIYDNVLYSIDGINWQADGTFTGLEANTVYAVYMRAGEHGTGTPGAISDALYVLTAAAGTAKGDVNADGKIQTTDAVWVLEQALGFVDMQNETVLDLSDMNDDGKINTLDARLILKMLVNTL